MRWGGLKKPQVRGGRLGARQKRQDGCRRVKDWYGIGGEDSAAIGAEKGRDSHKGVRESRVRQEVAGDRRGFVRKREFTS